MKKNIYRYYVILIALVFCFFSCEKKQKHYEEKKESGFKQPVTIIGSYPIVTIYDTCPEPETIIIPITKNNNYSNKKTNDRTLKLSPPSVSPILSGEAGGFSFMQNYSTDNGLPYDFIKCALLDKLGNLWFGTTGGGISRYDGKSFTNFTSAQGFVNNTVLSIMEDKAGNIWFGTSEGGACRYNGEFFASYTTAHGLANNTVESIIEDRMGNIWFGTDGGGVSRLDLQKITEKSKDPVYGNKRLQPDHKKINKDQLSLFTNFNTSHGLSNNVVLSITEDKKGNIWFGTGGGGASCYDGNRIDAIERGDKAALEMQQDLKKVNGKFVRSFTNYTTAQGLANDVVHNITEDKEGSLWFGTLGGGISRLNIDKDLSFETSENNTVNPGKQDNKKTNKVIGYSFTNFSTSQGLINDVVLCITEDKSGNLWIGTDGGVSRLNYHNVGTSDDKDKEETKDSHKKINKSGSYSFTNFTTSQGLASNSIANITMDKTGNLWFGTTGAGLSRYDGKAFTNFTTFQGLLKNQVWSIFEDVTGSLWFGTTEGVSCYDWNGPFYTSGEKANVKKGLKNDPKKNNMARGTYTTFTTSQGLANNSIWCILEDKTGDLWIGTTEGGVSRLNREKNKFTNFTTTQGLPDNGVVTILEDKTGNLWFGTQTGGVSRYDGNRVEAIQRGDIIAQQTQQDLKKINGKLVKSFTNYTTEQGLAHNMVNCILEDKNKNLWLGTGSGGVSRLNPNESVTAFTNFSKAQGLTDNCVLTIMEEKKGNLWFGTTDGVSRYDGKTFMNYNKAQGLPDNVIGQILTSKSFIGSGSENGECLLLGTNFGIAVLTGWTDKDGKNLPFENSGETSNEDLKNYTPVFMIYNSSTGYPVKDVNSGQNAMFKDSKGIIWIATGADKTALVRFDPSALNYNPEPLTVNVQSIKINNSAISWHYLADGQKNKSGRKENGLQKSVINSKVQTLTDTLSVPVYITEEIATFGRVLTEAQRDTMFEQFSDIKFDDITPFYPLPENLELPFKHNNITFDFAAIEPAKPHLVLYQYILDGYDNSWSPLTNKTTTTFGNIHEGDYTFRIKAKSPDGIWSKTVNYTFKVLPTWYRTWWMYLIYLTLGILLIRAVVRWREKKLKLEKIILEKKVELRTKQLEEKNKIVEEQKKIVEEKNTVITDSIEYAQNIQQAILPSEEDIAKHFQNHFVLYKPKDIVSGDFYWIYEDREQIFIAVADCTGHGVSGAFMSLMGNNLLNDTIKIKSSNTPAEILDELNVRILHTLKQNNKKISAKFGMDVALISVNKKMVELEYAGAHNPLLIYRKKLSPLPFTIEKEAQKDDEVDCIQIKANPCSIGFIKKAGEPGFSNHHFKLIKGDMLYLFSDGYVDQFGGPEYEKFYSQTFRNLLKTICELDMPQQKKILDETIMNWKGSKSQTDDILVIGIRI